MQTRVLLIAPYPGLAELATTLVEDVKGITMSVKQADLSEAVAIISQLNEQEYDVVISRGGTARLLRQHTNLPVVDIAISGFDILRLMVLVKNYESQVELIGFPSVIKGAISISELMGISIPYTVIDSEAEVLPTVERAKARGVSVIIGGTGTVITAEQSGLQGILITSGPESIVKAFDDAQYIHSVTNRYRFESQILSEIVEQIDDGISIITESGVVEYANAKFRENCGVLAHHEKRKIFEQLPALKKFTHCIDNHLEKRYQFSIEIKGTRYLLKGAHSNGDGIRRYRIELSRFPNDTVRGTADAPIEILYKEPFTISFTKLAGTSEVFQASLTHARKLANHSGPIVLVGEHGTGKRLFAEAIHSNSQRYRGSFVQMRIKKITKETAKGFIDFISKTEPETTLYITGFELLPLTLQRSLKKTFLSADCCLIFGFRKNTETLQQERKLTTGLIEYLNQAVISIPPLRDRIKDIDDYVRISIPEFNKSHGKQIVGARQNVLDSLYQMEWDGNVSELLSVIDQMVRNIDGPFIERIPADDGRYAPSNEVNRRNHVEVQSKQTLDEMMKDIMQRIVEEENMNLSKAARRLGVNRTTLWRKLRSDIN